MRTHLANYSILNDTTIRKWHSWYQFSILQTERAWLTKSLQGTGSEVTRFNLPDWRDRTSNFNEPRCSCLLQFYKEMVAILHGNGQDGAPITPLNPSLNYRCQHGSALGGRGLNADPSECCWTTLCWLDQRENKMVHVLPWAGWMPLCRTSSPR